MSNVIKSSFYISLDDARTIEAHLRKLHPPGMPDLQEDMPDKEPKEITEAKELKGQILEDAEMQAEEIIRQAREQSDRLLAQSQSEIEQWWQEQRVLDEEHIAAARSSGYESGYQDGLVQAEQQIRSQYAGMIEEAGTVLANGYELKQQIIQEAEPFLLELSCAIAAKIVDRQLTVSPEWNLDLIRQLLLRRREKGIITLCVAPQHFNYIQNARDELLLALDSQAELQILPDASVHDNGCVIRSSFGSIDGRIDSQLQEIKKALMQIAAQQEDATDDD